MWDAPMTSDHEQAALKPTGHGYVVTARMRQLAVLQKKVSRGGARSDGSMSGMTTRERPTGDFDYEAHGTNYASIRRPDPRIEARVHAALGPSHRLLNVGAGSGSYEPADRYVLALEPSAKMRAQRLGGSGASSCHGRRASAVRRR